MMTKTLNDIYLMIALLLLCPGVVLAKGRELSKKNQAVFNKVWKTLDIDTNIKAKPMVIIQSVGTGTQINHIKNTLIIDPKVLKICQSFGNQKRHALAFIFGQQLHVYQKRKTFALVPVGFRQPSDLSRFLKADKKGIIYAYIAGFPMLDIYEQLLSKIHKAFDKANNHTFRSRLGNAQRLKNKLRNFFLTFQTANYLLMANEGLAAHECYGYILKEYDSKEVLNNAGANLLKMMAEDSPHRKFVYPIVLDVSSQLIHQNFKNSNNRVTPKMQDQMRLHFNKILRKNAQYVPACLNLANLYTLTNKLPQAKAMIAKARMLAVRQKSALLKEIKVLQAIISYKSNQKKLAISQLLPLANAQTKNLAYYNLLVMKDADNDTLTRIFKGNENAQSFAEAETIADIDLEVPFFRKPEAWYADGSALAGFKGALNQKEGTCIYLDTLADKQQKKIARKIVFAQRGKLIYFVQTLPAYQGKTSVGGFGLGTDYQKIQVPNQYGFPLGGGQGTVFGGNKYAFRVFRKRRIIFKIDHNQRLVSWMTYYKVK